LVQLAIQETGIKTLVLSSKALLVIFMRKVVGRRDWRYGYAESEEIVWFLNYQNILWFTMIPFPYISLV
jgi:hypothetical protein